MEVDEVAKNLLANKICETCTRTKRDNMCVIYLDEAIGWQWWPMSKNGTCEQWEIEDMNK